MQWQPTIKMPINGQSKVDKTQSETPTLSVLVVYPTSFRFEDCYVTCNTVDAKARNYMKCGIELERRNFVHRSSEENSGTVLTSLSFINISTYQQGSDKEYQNKLTHTSCVNLMLHYDARRQCVRSPSRKNTAASFVRGGGCFALLPHNSWCGGFTAK